MNLPTKIALLALHQKIDHFRKIAFNDEFTDAYIDTALLDVDSDNPSDTRSLDVQHLSKECKAQMHQDCQRFQQQNAKLLEQAYESGGYSEGHAGQDFWLTRNGHGAGFKDGNIPYKLGDELALAAHRFGVQDLLLGDDGLIYYSPLKLLN